MWQLHLAVLVKVMRLKLETLHTPSLEHPNGKHTCSIFHLPIMDKESMCSVPLGGAGHTCFFKCMWFMSSLCFAVQYTTKCDLSYAHQSSSCKFHNNRKELTCSLLNVTMWWYHMGKGIAYLSNMFLSNIIKRCHLKLWITIHISCLRKVSSSSSQSLLFQLITIVVFRKQQWTTCSRF